MSKLFVDDKGRILDAERVELADRVMELKNKKDVWLVINELVNYWIKTTPEDVEAVKMNISDARENLTDKKYGETKGGKDFDRRFQLIFPTRLNLLIRAVYPAEELPMDRQFYRDFAKRYPGFKIAEKD